MNKQKWQIQEIAGVMLLGVALYILGRMVFFCFSDDIWYDEVFSAGMMRYSYKEIMDFTAKDVHPPFYYWYLKSVVNIGQALVPGLDAVVFAKLASWFPMMGIWGLAVTKIRKEFGLFVAGIFVFLVYSMPQLTVYGTEIRMYSLALFLVTAAILWGYEVYKTDNVSAFIGLFVCGILTAYTQYFSCIAIVILYLILGAAIKKDRAKIRKWFLCIIGSCVMYLPWLPTLIRQFTTVNENYWIQPLTWRSFAGCVKYIYLPSGGYPVLNYVLAVAMIFSTLGLGILYLKKRVHLNKWRMQDEFLLILGFGVLAGLIFIGVVVSILVSPVFVYRYMIPCLGGFWLAYALLVKDCEKKWIWIPVMFLMIYVGYINVKGVFWEENNKLMQMKETRTGLEQVKEDDILIFNFNHVQAAVGYYKNNESYLLYQEPENLIQEIYRDYGMIEDVEQVKELLKAGRKVWFLGSFVSREDIVEEWQQQGISVKEMGSYLLERYWFNLYAIE